jgi:ribosomal subunit interface protein
MDVVVNGRHCQIPEDLRERITSRLQSIERFKDRVIRIEVQITVDKSRRNDQNTQAEITLISKGPVVRAVAVADDKTVAFEHALDKLKSQLRKASDRRKTHRGLRIADVLDHPLPPPSRPEVDDDAPPVRSIAGLEVVGDGPLVVREKHFTAAPLTLAQALDEMELVGHDFFLYVDAETRLPSVVYRRKAYDYGVIHLEVK